MTEFFLLTHPEREATLRRLYHGEGLSQSQVGLGLDVPITGKRRKVQEGVWTTERGYDKGQDWFNWREDGQKPEEAA